MITFEKVRFKNFGSFGNTFTEINLVKDSTTLVHGNNGQGKSFALLDSITFGLFGKPFRKIKIPQIVNSINEKDCVVEIEFSANKSRYKIIRGIKPKVFEIYKNDVLIDQHAKSRDYQVMLEEQILKMNYKSFTQVVILGSSSFVPFMQLNAYERREVIEDILDIEIFSVMNTVLKTKIASKKHEIKEYEYNIEITKDKITNQKNYIQKLKEKSQDSVNSFEEEIKSNKSVREDLVKEINEIEKEMKSLHEKIKDRPSFNEKYIKLSQVHKQLKSKVNEILENITFYEESDVCSVCKQDIDSEHKEKQIKEKKNKISELENAMEELTTQEGDLKNVLVEIDEKSGELHAKQTQSNFKKSSVSAAEQYIKQLEEKIQTILSEKVEDDTSKEKLASLYEELEKLNSERSDVLEDLYYCNIATRLLKDTGIKAKIIKYYLPIMNKLINQYLSDMDFFVNFTLDENFDETIKSRYRDEFGYMNFSEGEKMRIDLALLLSWRDIARIKNSVNTNLLILDEVFDSSLDAVGTDEFMKLLRIVGKKSNVFVISHKADQLFDKFDNTIGFKKKKNFSKVTH
jgi:DNA repair exonuclease SbcCD ATPase subunit